MNLLVYGPAGHGKTTLVGTAAGDKRLMPGLLLDFEGGVASIKSKIRRVDIKEIGQDLQTEKLDQVKISRWEDFTTIYNLLARHPEWYRLVVIDSLSEVNNLNLNEAVSQARVSNRNHDPDVPERQDYLKSLVQMRKMIRFFRDLECHVVMTASVKELEDPLTRKYKSHPSVNGQLVTELPGIFDALGYLALLESESEATRRILIFASSNQVEAKIRVEGGQLPRLEDPTLPKLLDALEGFERQTAKGK